MRIIGIDYGLKRIGVAVTDMEQILASPLKVVTPQEVIGFLRMYMSQEPVEGIVIGLPKNLDNTDTDGTQLVKGFVKKLKTEFPAIFVEVIDERYTSKMARALVINSGINKKARRDKTLIDQLSAEIILSDYLKLKHNRLKK